MTRRVILFAAIVAAVLATPAGAAVKIQGVDTTRQPTVQLSVVTDTPSSRAPRVREDGHPVSGFDAQNLGRTKSVVIAIDRSNSMRGRPIVDAAAAARDFVGHKTDTDRIAVVTFGHEAIQATRFSSSTIDSDSALGHLNVDTKSGTALYDAVRISALTLSTELNPGRVIVLLTDGNNVAEGGASLQQAIRAARDAGAVVYAIGIEGRDFSPGPLRRIASETGGSYYGAKSSGALIAAYDAISAELARTWRVTYLTSARPGQELNLTASVPGHGRASARASLPGHTEVPREGLSRFIPRVFFTSGIGAFLISLAVGTAILLAVGLAMATPSSARLRRRIEPHVAGARRAQKKVVKERFGAASGLLAATEQAFMRFSFWRKLNSMLQRADVPLRTAEFFYIMVAPAFALGLFSAVLGLPTLFILAFMAFGALVPLGVLVYKARKRINAIDNQLPDLLITMAASLKAGHSFRQAMQAVVSEGAPPITDEFKRVLTEAQLGRSMDDALSEMSERVQSKNLSFVLTAVTIQRQVGGSLAGIFDMVADAVRQRQAFARKIKALTAMGRASAYTLVAMPFVLALIITALNRDYMAPMWNESLGHKMIILGLVMMAIGSYMLRKIASFRG